jgi:SnoaL-like domain
MRSQLTLSVGMAMTAGLITFAVINAQTRSMPVVRRQPTPNKVVEEHLAAFNACNWNRLMAQFPENVEFFSPNGAVVRGREALGNMFAKVVKPPSQGGTCGLTITPEHIFVVGETVNVQWRAEAPFLAEPYRGADAYETHDGLMAAQVTTFDQSALKMKASKGP